MSTSFQRDRLPKPRFANSWRMLVDTLTVGGWTAVAKLAGALKVILAARFFGAGDAMDAFLIAFLVPSFFMDILASPIDAALVPSLIELREKQGKAQAEALYSTVLATVGAAFCLTTLLTAAGSGWLLMALAPGFSREKLNFTNRLLLLMMLVVPLNGLSCTCRAVLNAYRKFGYSAAIPAITPIASIVALVVAGKQSGVMALAAGTVVGATIETVLGFTCMKQLGYPILPRWSGVTAALRQTAAQYAPLVAITLVMTGSTLVDQGMAARLGSGSVAVLSYGTRLLGVLIVIGPTAVGTAVLPHLATAAVVSDPAAGRQVLRTYGAYVAALVLPATALLIYFSGPIVYILFQQGAFSRSAADLVTSVQQASLLQLPISVLLALEVRVTSAWRANRLLYRVAALSLLLAVALDMIGMRWLGVVGIPLAGCVVRLVSGLYLSCKIYGFRRASSGL